MARTPKTTSAPSRREEILAVAAQVMAERGLASATVRDIGQAAGILSGSLYYHFESKEQMVLDLLLPSVLESNANARRIVEEASSHVEAVTELIRESVSQTAAHPHNSLILRNEARAFAESPALAPLADARREVLGIWVGEVKGGVKTGEFRDDIVPDVAVRAMFDSVLGAARWFIGDKRVKPERVTETLVAMHVNGLAKR